MTKTAIENKHEIRKQYGSTSAYYRISKAETKKLVRKDKLKYTEKELDSISKLSPSKQYYAAIKKLKSNPKNISWGIKDKNDNILTSKSEILERWAEFYVQFYFDDSLDTEIDDSTEDPIPKIIKSEIIHAINHLKTGKSPGLDNILYIQSTLKQVENPLLMLSIYS